MGRETGETQQTVGGSIEEREKVGCHGMRFGRRGGSRVRDHKRIKNAENADRRSPVDIGGKKKSCEEAVALALHGSGFAKRHQHMAKKGSCRPGNGSSLILRAQVPMTCSRKGRVTTGILGSERGGGTA